MKNCLVGLFGLISLLALGECCSLYSPRTAAAPSGPVFPMVQAHSIPYKGQVVTPSLTNGSLYFFVTSSGQVHAVNPETGEVAWIHESAQPVSGPLGLGRERLYFVDDQNVIHCLDSSGEPLWAKALEETITGPLREFGGWLYAGTVQGSLWGLALQDGQEAWRFQAKAAIRTGALLWKNKQGKTVVLCGGDEGKIYFLTDTGQLRGSQDCGAKVILPPLLDGDRLYCGTEDQKLLCLDLARGKIPWRVRLTGQVSTTPVADKRRLFVLTAQGVLMCLSKRSGVVLWWRSVSSRSAYELELADGQVVVTSLSSTLFSFDVRDGREVGRFQADREFRSNPVWKNPYLFVHLSSRPDEEKGNLLLLKKLVKVTLSSSKDPPQKVAEEVVFTAAAVGFHQPKYEFLLKSGDKERVVQEASVKDTWSWFPEEEGEFRIVVRVSDGQERKEAEMLYQIIR